MGNIKQTNKVTKLIAIIYAIFLIFTGALYVLAADGDTPSTTPAQGQGTQPADQQNCINTYIESNKQSCETLKKEAENCTNAIASEIETKKTECNAKQEPDIIKCAKDLLSACGSDCSAGLNESFYYSQCKYTLMPYFNNCMSAVYQKSTECNTKKANSDKCFSDLQQKANSTCQGSNPTPTPTTTTGAQEYDQQCYNNVIDICKSGLDTQYLSDKADCKRVLDTAKAKCEGDYLTLTGDLKSCNSQAEIAYQNCLTTAELNKTDKNTKCETDVKDQCKYICGNGKVEGSEECDDGNKVSQDGCSDKCKKDSVCGNGKVEYGEECDDNNNKAGDGCNAKCQKEDVFRVSDYLKIEEGQSYLDRNSTSQNSTSLKKGVFDLIIKAIEFLTKIIGSFALFFVILGGIIMMVSSGNSGLQQKGKRMILYAAIGLVVAFTSLIIVTFVQSLFYTT